MCKSHINQSGLQASYHLKGTKSVITREGNIMRADWVSIVSPPPVFPCLFSYMRASVVVKEVDRSRSRLFLN